MGTRVYIGRLSYDAREREVERFFRGYGRIRDIMLKNGYGFVEFDDDRDADDAVYELNGKDLCGERVSVELARGPKGDDFRDRGYRGRRGGGPRRDKYGPPTRTEYRLIVENLSSRVSWQDLKDYMRQAGEVTYADAHKKQQNEGVIEFATRSDMDNALDKLDGTEINGRKIRLVEQNPRKRSRSRSGSRSKRRDSRSRKSRSRSARRSRSASRSRSRSRSRRDRSRSRSRSASKGRSKSKSRSPTPQRKKSASRSPSPQRKRSASRSPSRSRSRSHSHSNDQANGDGNGDNGE